MLCLLAYARALSLPLIADDYLQVQLGRDYGPVSGWPELARDALYRCRATSILLTHWTEAAFGLSPFALNASSLVLHVFNTWLVLALGCWRAIGWRLSFAAACFFAIQEGHQEAVMWYAAIPELLVFFFAVASLLFWIRWLQADGGGELNYAASLVCYVVALASKESAVAVAPLAVVAAIGSGRGLRDAVWRLVPFGALAAVYFALIFAARDNHQHFQDGTFSLHAPFWIVLPVSIGRLLWVWGLSSLIALALWRARQWTGVLWIAAAWIVITFLPYSFLTYMSRVPSRHTYFASAGLSLIVAAAFLTVRERAREPRWLTTVLAASIVLQQCAYLWTRKQEQYVMRAAPTERLLKMAAGSRSPLTIQCFPYHPSLARMAVEQRYGNRIRLRFGPARGALDLCTQAQPNDWIALHRKAPGTGL